MKLKRAVAIFFVALSLPVAGPAATKPANDDYVNDVVRQKLAADPVVKGGSITVEVKDGVVTMTGKVQEPKQKARAEKIAQKVKGVKKVINNVQIERP